MSQCIYSWELSLLFSDYSPKLEDTHYSKIIPGIVCRSLAGVLHITLCWLYRSLIIMLMLLYCYDILFFFFLLLDVELLCREADIYHLNRISCIPSDGTNISVATCSIDGAPPIQCELHVTRFLSHCVAGNFSAVFNLLFL